MTYHYHFTDKTGNVLINITMRGVRVNIDAPQCNVLRILSVCGCTLSYPPCNAHAPYCHLLPVRLYHIFSHYLIYGAIFGSKKVIDLQICVLYRVFQKELYNFESL